MNRKMCNHRDKGIIVIKFPSDCHNVCFFKRESLHNHFILENGIGETFQVTSKE
jgi:hypothetical protein